MKYCNGIKYLLLLFAICIVTGLAYYLGDLTGYNTGFSDGYTRGQVVLSLALMNKLDNFVDDNTPKDSYSHFLSVKDISMYIRDEEGKKTLAFWKFKPVQGSLICNRSQATDFSCNDSQEVPVENN